MNINTSTIRVSDSKTQQVNSSTRENSDANFSEELKSVSNASSKEISNEAKDVKTESKKTDNQNSTDKIDKQNKVNKKDGEVDDKSDKTNQNNKNVEDAIGGLNSVINKLNQSDDKKRNSLKNKLNISDKLNEDAQLINNDFNIQDTQDKLPQMSLNMGFNSDGQPFASFMNNEGGSQSEQTLSMNAKDLAEEAAILSTMAENMAMANKNVTVLNNSGIKKVDSKSGMVEDTIVKYDTLIMNEADVDVFANLVQNGEVDINKLTTDAANKSTQVSKTLADMLAKAMEDNKPIRIEFDNNISVIIRVSREGKLTADFLPSSQVAEAYLKENLPILKQKFDNENIEYDELNQRERREQDREQNRKKGREDE